ncbi:MAG: hypothetical protein AAF908_07440, partial [Pseudomonadota bacterium]
MDLFSSSIASRLYQSAQGALKPEAPQPQSDGPSFRKTAASFLQALRSGDTTAIDGMAGRAD